MCICTQCGGETNALTVGVIMTATDNSGRTHYCPRGVTRKHVRDLPSGVHLTTEWSEVTDPSVRIPVGLCEACEERHAAAHAAVVAGGVFFQCTQCGAEGAVKAGPLAAAVREHHGIEAPGLCGVEFDECEEHGVKAS